LKEQITELLTKQIPDATPETIAALSDALFTLLCQSIEQQNHDLTATFNDSIASLKETYEALLATAKSGTKGEAEAYANILNEINSVLAQDNISAEETQILHKLNAVVESYLSLIAPVETSEAN
jgi:predicted RNA-binding Zn ribbon-like protein